MLRGELRGDEQTLEALKINKTSKLMLIGTKLQDVMAVATASETSKELEKDPSDVKVNQNCGDSDVIISGLSLQNSCHRSGIGPLTRQLC